MTQFMEAGYAVWLATCLHDDAMQLCRCMHAQKDNKSACILLVSRPDETTHLLQLDAVGQLLLHFVCSVECPVIGARC